MEQRVQAAHLNLAFGALADASRREVIRLLSQKPRRAGELAKSIHMTPPALSRHLRVLRRAGLIAEEGIEEDARVRIYTIHPSAFQPILQWMSQADDLLRRQLQSLKVYAEGVQKGRKAKV